MVRAIGLIFFGILAVIVIAISLTACSPQTGVILGDFGQGGVGYENTAVADYIVIAGKITNPTDGRWLNDYTVIPYLGGVELSQSQARAISRTDKFFGSGEGVHDGCFVIYIPNRYELTASHVFINGNKEPVTMQYKDGGFTGRSDLYLWLDEVNPGDIFRLAIPDKQIEYAIAVMPHDNAHLDPSYIHRDTLLDKDGNVSVRVKEGVGGGIVDGPGSLGAPGWEREFTPARNMTYQEVWLLYVSVHATNLNQYTFAQEVVRMNPELVQTGGFVVNETYYLPDVP